MKAAEANEDAAQQEFSLSGAAHETKLMSNNSETITFLLMIYSPFSKPIHWHCMEICCSQFSRFAPHF
jgi:hypothetical protein